MSKNNWCLDNLINLSIRWVYYRRRRFVFLPGKNTQEDMNYSYRDTLTVVRWQHLDLELRIEHFGRWFGKQKNSNLENWENHWLDQCSLIICNCGTVHQRKHSGYCSSWWMKILRLKMRWHWLYLCRGQHNLFLSSEVVTVRSQ